MLYPFQLTDSSYHLIQVQNEKFIEIETFDSIFGKFESLSPFDKLQRFSLHSHPIKKGGGSTDHIYPNQIHSFSPTSYVISRKQPISWRMFGILSASAKNRSFCFAKVCNPYSLKHPLLQSFFAIMELQFLLTLGFLKWSQ
jgi:hypothetical protein